METTLTKPSPPSPPRRASAAPGSARRFWGQGEPMVWVCGAMLSTTLILIGALIFVVMANGLGAFWPAPLARATLRDGAPVLGVITARQPSADHTEERMQFKVANRDLYGMDFRWIAQSAIARIDYPRDAIVLE